MTHLTDKALLVQLNISQWAGRKLDRKATQLVADSNNTRVEAGRYNKNLLPLNDYLSDVHKKAGSIRNKFYANTLPWGIEGTQLLPTANYMEFMAEFRTERQEWNTLVNRFVSNYDHMVDEAKLFLGDLFQEADYPPASSIAQRFNMDLAAFPVPTADFRVNLGDEELDKIQKDVEERVKQAQAQAMTDVWKRLYDRVQTMADKLADPKAVFRDSLLENTAELCALLPRLNFADDQQLEAMRLDVEHKLLKFQPDALRSDLTLRRDTAAEAKAIMDKMSVFMQGI